MRRLNHICQQLPQVTEEKKERDNEYFSIGEYTDTAVIKQLAVLTKAVGQISELVDDFNYVNENRFGGIMSKFMGDY